MNVHDELEEEDFLEDSEEQKEFLRKPFRRVNEYRHKSKVQRANKENEVEV